MRLRWRTISPYTPSSGRILDVGCSSGAFLQVMDEEGWDVYGLDISRESCREARLRWGDRVRVTDWPDGDLPRTRFDLVTMFDVLEHCRDPRAAIRRTRDLLGPGGLLAVATHDFSSIHRRLMGRRWSYLDPEEHLYYFSPASLTGLLDDAGYAALRVERTKKWVSIDFLLGEMESSNPVLYRCLAPILRGLLSGQMRRRPFFLPLGEFMIIGRKSVTPRGSDGGAVPRPSAK